MRELSYNFVKLVSLLSDGEYHDGTSIGERLAITRAAVWKLIQKLDHYGIAYSSLKGRGYRLDEPLKLLDAEQIISLLHQRKVTLGVFEKLPSTNDYLKQQATNNRKIAVCLAESQTSGKGRLARGWHSPFAQNIYLSILYPIERDISELSGLSLVVALAAAQAIEKALSLEPNCVKVKWPNDLYIDKSKLGGLLIECEAESNGFCQLIIGAGVNVNMQKALKKEINQRWSSLSKITGCYIDRNTLSALIISTMIASLECFAEHGFAYFKDEWQQRDHLQTKKICVKTVRMQRVGHYEGITEQGHLILKDPSGTRHTHAFGDATIVS